MSELNLRSIKLKICIIGEKKDEHVSRFNKITNDTWKAANIIVGGQFFNDELARRIHSRRKIKLDDQKAIGLVEEEFKAFFGTKRQATSERDIKNSFPDLPSCITNSLNRLVCTAYNSDRKNIVSGKSTLRTYRKGMPVPTTKQSIYFYHNQKKYGFIWHLARSEKIEFKIIFGKDKVNNRLTFRKIMSGEIEFGIPQIQRKKKSLYLILPIKEKVKKSQLNYDLSVGVDLGIVVPAYICLSTGDDGSAIGSIDDLFRVRIQFQKRYAALQKRISAVQGGKGRKKKLKALSRLKSKEANFVRSYNHYISKEIVRFALKYHAGIINLEHLEGYGETNGNSFFLRNWGYFSLQKFISYKAKRVGIKVQKIDPFRTSKTCSACGHYDEGQRHSQSDFICKFCGIKLNADHNAALNIARSEAVVESKEECEFYIRRQKRNEDGVLL